MRRRGGERRGASRERRQMRGELEQMRRRVAELESAAATERQAVDELARAKKELEVQVDKVAQLTTQISYVKDQLSAESEALYKEQLANFQLVEESRSLRQQVEALKEKEQIGDRALEDLARVRGELQSREKRVERLAEQVGYLRISLEKANNALYEEQANKM